MIIWLIILSVLCTIQWVFILGLVSMQIRTANAVIEAHDRLDLTHDRIDNLRRYLKLPTYKETNS